MRSFEGLERGAFLVVVVVVRHGVRDALLLSADALPIGLTAQFHLQKKLMLMPNVIRPGGADGNTIEAHVDTLINKES